MSAPVDTTGAVTWPAAVSPLVEAAVEGPTRRRRVLGAFATCVYVELGRHHQVLAVHTPDAVQLPIGLRLAGPARLNETVRSGDVVTVGGGRVRLPGADIVAVRRLRPSRVRFGGETASRAWQTLSLVVPGAGIRPDRDGLDAIALRLCAAALLGGPVQPGVDRLVGAGRGLTPSGDDLLCGILLTLRAFEGPAAGALGAVRGAVTSRLPRTTSISAALITAAAQGWAAPDVVRLLAVLAGRTPLTDAELCRLWQRVHSIGHTSGGDLLAGITATLAALSERDDEANPLEARCGRREAIGA